MLNYMEYSIIYNQISYEVRNKIKAIKKINRLRIKIVLLIKEKPNIFKILTSGTI